MLMVMVVVVMMVMVFMIVAVGHFSFPPFQSVCRLGFVFLA